MQPTIVLKFGGTALGSPSRVRRAASSVARLAATPARVIVVVSANGHRTDRLVAAARAVSPQCAPETFSSREFARLLATGEDASAALFAIALQNEGATARSVRGAEAGLHASGSALHASLHHVDVGPLVELLQGGRIPVVSGFHATREDGDTVLLGRGSSDLVAIAITAAIRRVSNAPVDCEIVTDVAGVFERDPAITPHARRFDRITFDTLCALADRGDQVVHARAARLAAETDTPFRVRHWRQLHRRSEGTMVGASVDVLATRSATRPVVAMTAS
jgi:aspartate kinase